MIRKVFGLIVLSVGFMMLSRSFGWYDFEWFFNYDWSKILVPALVILIGAKLIFSPKGHRRKSKSCEVSENKDGELPKMSVAFFGNAYNFNGKHFRGAKLEAFMGCVTLDLAGSDIENGAVIDVLCLMAGVKLRVPQDINIEIHSDCLLGGVSNKKQRGNALATKTIVLRANCLLGGVDIK